MAVVKKTVSIPEEMYDAALARAKNLRYDSFSAYIKYLVEQDLKERPPHTVVRIEEPPPRASATTSLRVAEEHLPENPIRRK